MSTKESLAGLFGSARSESLPSWRTIGIHLILITFSIIAVAPFIYAFLTSIKPSPEILGAPLQPITANPTAEHYISFWTEHPFDRWFLNSLIVTTGGVFLSLVFDSLAGFALAKGEFRGNYAIYLLVIGTFIIPPQAIMVPLYVQMGWIGWQNTYWGIMIMIVSAPFGVFLMRQFYITISDSYIEAAKMDGCSTFQIYFRIMLPMGKSALAALAIFKFIFMWGAFLWPLIIVDSSAMFPIPVGLGLFEGQYGDTPWGQVLAASLLTATPVLVAYLMAQEAFMKGIALQGGTKG